MPPVPSIELADMAGMQTTVWKLPPENDHRQRCTPSKRKLVTQALRDAYRRHVRDSLTRMAVKQTLGA